MEQEIKNLLYELGIPVIQKQKQVSPCYTTIHYNLADITKLNRVQQVTKFLSAYLHSDITMKKSNIGHFALLLPNETKNTVNFYNKDYNFIFNKNICKPRSVFAGVDDENIPQMFSVDEFPHILISGTTGSGKSVTLNSIICSILRSCRFLPDDSKPEFYMIDTKRVELSHYKSLSDKCKIATNVPNAIEYLADACTEIDARYLTMEKHGEKLMPSHIYRKFVIIEELGDLMIGSKGVVEKYIVKIAQLGRACGVHLIIATQRPTVDVVTGSIKANIGCRFALQTTSAIDSRNILGHNGAENLTGKGDCLLKLPTMADEIHLQCPFISDDDIQKTIKEFLEKE